MDPITTAELLAFLSDFFLVKEFCSDAQSSGKSKLKNAIKRHKDLTTINEKLNDLLSRAFKEFQSSTMEEEYDFQGLCEFYGNGFLEKLNRYLTATGSERADIESDILLNAQKAAKGKSPKANERVEKLTQQVLNTIYGFYRDQASQSEKLLAGEVENTVISSTTEIKNDIRGLKDTVLRRNETIVVDRDKLASTLKRIEIWLAVLVFLFSVVALAISALPALLYQTRFLQNILLALCGIAVLLVILILILYYIKRRTQRKLRITDVEFMAEKKKNQIKNSVFHALHEANTGKISATLRYTYGKVAEWNPINYEKNRLVYDVHEQIRNILKSLQNIVISIDPERFNDKNVSVDLVCCYPEDVGIDSEVPIKKRPQSEVDGNEEQPFEAPDKPWKLISSGDLSGNHRRTLDYLSEPLSFYAFLSYCGSWFANRKYEKQEIDDELIELYLQRLRDECHCELSPKEEAIIKGKTFFVRNVRDYENSRYNSTKKDWDGSAVGTTICVRNDNPEHVLVKAILTINTFGEPLFFATNGKSPYDYDKYGLSEKDYEELFLKQIVGTYRTLIASELAQMYIRHLLQKEKISSTTGEHLKKLPTTTSVVQ